MGTPGKGYFAEAFPQVRDEAKKLKVWQREVRLVRARNYPDVPAPPGTRPATRVPEDHSWLREPTIIAAIIGLVGTLITVLVTVWISSRHDESSEPRQTDRPAANIVETSHNLITLWRKPSRRVTSHS